MDGAPEVPPRSPFLTSQAASDRPVFIQIVSSQRTESTGAQASGVLSGEWPGSGPAAQFPHSDSQNEAAHQRSKTPKLKLECPTLVPSPSVGEFSSLPHTQKETAREERPFPVTAIRGSRPRLHPECLSAHPARPPPAPRLGPRGQHHRTASGTPAPLTLKSPARGEVCRWRGAEPAQDPWAGGHRVHRDPWWMRTPVLGPSSRVLEACWPAPGPLAVGSTIQLVFSELLLG